MADDMSVRHGLMQAVGSASIAVSIIDNSPDACPTCAKTRAALVDGFNGRPRVKPQTCPRGVHRDWWADGDDLDCPWCEIDDLRADRDRVEKLHDDWTHREDYFDYINVSDELETALRGDHA